jgi:membrane-associated phospholipid phosphatase
MNQLLALDQYFFFWINSGLSNPYFDAIMPLLRNAPNWVPMYIFFAAFLVYNFGRKGLYILGFAIVAIALSDQLSSTIIKPLVHRIRPCNDAHMIEHVRLVINSCGAGFSFPSSHAVNHFTIALFLISVLPKQIKWVKPFLLIWASAIVFAQVYVGVHYPLDVIFGALLGSLIGFFIAGLTKSVFHIDLDNGVEVSPNDQIPITKDNY